MEMKLAEALILRADCQKRFEQLKARAESSAMVQEGAQPAENPAELIAELYAVARELGLLIKRINRTNSVTLFEGEREPRQPGEALALMTAVNRLQGRGADLSLTSDSHPCLWSVLCD